MCSNYMYIGSLLLTVGSLVAIQGKCTAAVNMASMASFLLIYGRNLCVQVTRVTAANFVGS